MSGCIHEYANPHCEDLLNLFLLLTFLLRKPYFSSFQTAGSGRMNHSSVFLKASKYEKLRGETVNDDGLDARL